jgi:hypothetical protein
MHEARKALLSMASIVFAMLSEKVGGLGDESWGDGGLWGSSDRGGK